MTEEPLWKYVQAHEDLLDIAKRIVDELGKEK